MSRAQTMNVDQIKNEIVRYLSVKPKVLQAALLSQEILMNRYSRKLTYL